MQYNFKDLPGNQISDNPKTRFTGIFFIGLLFILFGWWRCNELKRNGIIIIGKITSYDFPAKSSIHFNYEFTYRNKIITGDWPEGVYDPSIFIGKVFPVMYSPKSGISQLLLQPLDFKKFKLPYPDSLRWVIKYLKW